MPMPVAAQSRLHARHGTAAPIDQTNHCADEPHDGGFVLIEVLVGMIMFAIVTAGATLAVVGGVQTTSISSARIGAANVAQQVVQQAQTLPRATLAATPSATSTVIVGNASYVVQRQVSYSPTSATACPTTIVAGTPYSMIVHVVVTGTGQNARTVTMDTALAC